MAAGRAQTAHDFALGMGVFLLTVAFVFSTLPTLGAAFEERTTDQRTPRAGRLAATLLHELSAGEGPGRLDPTRTATFFRTNASGGALREFLGLGDRWGVNVSVRNASGVVHVPDAGGDDVALAAGDAAGDRPTATRVRVVSFADGTACRPACRLVVRGW